MTRRLMIGGGSIHLLTSLSGIKATRRHSTVADYPSTECGKTGIVTACFRISARNQLVSYGFIILLSRCSDDFYRLILITNCSEQRYSNVETHIVGKS